MGEFRWFTVLVITIAFISLVIFLGMFVGEQPKRVDISQYVHEITLNNGVYCVIVTRSVGYSVGISCDFSSLK